MGKGRRLGAAWLLIAASGAAVMAARAQEPQTAKPPTADAPAIAAKLLPVEAFAELPFMEGPQLSPDGNKIAAKVALNGKQFLVILSMVNGEQKIARITPGDNDLNWWRWVNDDWLVLGIGAEVAVDGGEKWYATRAIGASADGTKVNPLGWKVAAQKGDDLLWVAKDGSPRIVLAMQRSIYLNDAGFWPDVQEADVSTGKMREIVPSKASVGDWYADATGTVRMGLGYVDASRQSLLYYRPSDKDGFRLLQVANGRKDENLRAPALFLAEPGKALAYDDSSGFDELRALDMTKLTLGDPVFYVPGYDIGGIITDAAGTGLAGVRFTDTRERVHWIDPAMIDLQAQFDKAVGASRFARIVSWDRARDRFIVEVGGPDRPSAYYSYGTDDGTLRVLARTYEKIPVTGQAPVRSIRYKARDGLEIEAVLTLPKGREAKNLPLILMPHGGPFARDLEEWDWIAQFLANRGYAVIQPNYRGSSGYGNAFAAKGEGQWGLAMQDDLNDTVDHLVKEGIADARRVCIVGASYGGYAAMRGAQRDGGRYRCAISYAGVSNLGAMMRYDSHFLNAGSRRAWMKEQAPDFKAVSPINYAASFSTPILLMHGKMDRRVPVDQSRDMAEKLKAAGKPYRYVEQPLGDHFFSRQEDRLQFLQEMEAFLAANNPA
ncbi:alpha/beta hydrolase family protein [Sphingobium nicotianae]|nr:S9 family peptidase [Sphingobium nicotianae]